ncbi:hypothetical protein TWF281_002751 [Arthrobotrys megalospora]
MSTQAYSSNILTHRNPVASLSSSINITENTTILVRLSPDKVTLDIPFNRVTTWDRLIQTIFDIYMRNNPSARYLTIYDALDNIKIKNDLTGGIILPELWPDFIKPQVKVAAIFNEPFRRPPWLPRFNAEVKREEEDVEMMEGVVTYAIEPKLGGFVETEDWRKQSNRLIGPPPSKADDTEHFHLLSASSNAIPTLPFAFTSTSTFTNSWATMETEKSRLRHHSNMNGTSLFSEVCAETLLAHRSMSQEPTVDSMIEGSVSPPPSISFRNPFPQSGLSGSSPPPQAMFPQRFTPVRHIPSDANSRTPTQSPECSSRPVRDANPRPAKRKRDEDDKVGSSPIESYIEPPRKSRSPFQSAGSNGGISRGQSVDTDSPGELSRVTNLIPRTRASDSDSARTVVLHQRLPLLDSINAGEMVKVIRTKDGNLFVIRDDEEPEDFMERRQSTASSTSFSGLRDKTEIGTTKTSRKRPHGEAQAGELVRIWSGCPEPPAKRKKAKLYNKLSSEQKAEILGFVQEQHIIRIDHFTNPVIQEWKTRTIPDADPKQTEEYLEEVASNIYNDTNKKKEAYRLFMENHNHSHKNSDSASSTKA